MSLKFGVLGLLNHTPMTGYNLKKLFDKTLNNIWAASLSQIYRELGVLEKDGFVSSEVHQQDDRPDKRIYSISEEGKQAFQAWLSEYPDTFVSPKRDEFMLKIFFGSDMGRPDVKKQLELFIKDRENAIEALDRDTQMLPELIAAFLVQPNMKEDEERYLRFIVNRAQLTNKLLVQWATDCIKELNDLEKKNEAKEVT